MDQAITDKIVKPLNNRIVKPIVTSRPAQFLKDVALADRIEITQVGGRKFDKPLGVDMGPLGQKLSLLNTASESAKPFFEDDKTWGDAFGEAGWNITKEVFGSVVDRGFTRAGGLYGTLAVELLDANVQGGQAVLATNEWDTNEAIARDIQSNLEETIKILANGSGYEDRLIPFRGQPLPPETNDSGGRRRRQDEIIRRLGILLDILRNNLINNNRPFDGILTPPWRPSGNDPRPPAQKIYDDKLVEARELIVRAERLANDIDSDRIVVQKMELGGQRTLKEVTARLEELGEFRKTLDELIEATKRLNELAADARRAAAEADGKPPTSRADWEQVARLAEKNAKTICGWANQDNTRDLFGPSSQLADPSNLKKAANDLINETAKAIEAAEKQDTDDTPTERPSDDELKAAISRVEALRDKLESELEPLGKIGESLAGVKKVIDEARSLRDKVSDRQKELEGLNVAETVDKLLEGYVTDRAIELKVRADAVGERVPQLRRMVDAMNKSTLDSLVDEASQAQVKLDAFADEAKPAIEDANSTLDEARKVLSGERDEESTDLDSQPTDGRARALKALQKALECYAKIKIPKKGPDPSMPGSEELTGTIGESSGKVQSETQFKRQVQPDPRNAARFLAEYGQASRPGLSGERIPQDVMQEVQPHTLTRHPESNIVQELQPHTSTRQPDSNSVHEVQPHTVTNHPESNIVEEIQPHTMPSVPRHSGSPTPRPYVPPKTPPTVIPAQPAPPPPQRGPEPLTPPRSSPHTPAPHTPATPRHQEPSAGAAASEGFQPGDGAKVDPQLAGAVVTNGALEFERIPTVKITKPGSGERTAIELWNPTLVTENGVCWFIKRYAAAADATAVVAQFTEWGEREDKNLGALDGAVVKSRYHASDSLMYISVNQPIVGTIYQRTVIYRERFVIVYNSTKGQFGADLHTAGEAAIAKSRELIDLRFPDKRPKPLGRFLPGDGARVAACFADAKVSDGTTFPYPDPTGMWKSPSAGPDTVLIHYDEPKPNQPQQHLIIRCYASADDARQFMEKVHAETKDYEDSGEFGSVYIKLVENSPTQKGHKAQVNTRDGTGSRSQTSTRSLVTLYRDRFLISVSFHVLRITEELDGQVKQCTENAKKLIDERFPVK